MEIGSFQLGTNFSIKAIYEIVLFVGFHLCCMDLVEQDIRQSLYIDSLRVNILVSVSEKHKIEKKQRFFSILDPESHSDIHPTTLQTMLAPQNMACCFLLSHTVKPDYFLHCGTTVDLEDERFKTVIATDQRWTLTRSEWEESMKPANRGMNEADSP